MLVPGQTICSDYIMLDQAKIDAYARVSTDLNPLHIDPQFARSKGYAGTIAHGRLTLSYAADFLTQIFGRDWLTSGVLEVKFTAPVLAGEQIQVSLHRLEGENPVELALTCTTQAGVTVIKGSARVTVSK